MRKIEIAGNYIRDMVEIISTKKGLAGLSLIFALLLLSAEVSSWFFLGVIVFGAWYGIWVSEQL